MEDFELTLLDRLEKDLKKRCISKNGRKNRY